MTEPMKPVGWISSMGSFVWDDLKNEHHRVNYVTPVYTATQLAERDRAIVLATLEVVDSAILASIGSGSNLQAAIKSIDPDQILKEMKL